MRTCEWYYRLVSFDAWVMKNQGKGFIIWIINLIVDSSGTINICILWKAPRITTEMPKKINIFFSVIDNLGDIGFACELIRSFQESWSEKYSFDIWTNQVEKVELFFSKNIDVLWSYCIRDIHQIWEKQSCVSLLLFQIEIPKNYPYWKNELFLRIDYLSFDKEWIKYHGTEHFDSRPGRRIIECIPSPLYGWGGVIFPPKRLIWKKELAKKFWLDHQKKWISIFSYKKTQEECLKIESLKETQVLIFWSEPKKEGSDSFIFLPFLSLHEFTSILNESEWAIIRWEVSFITTLQLKTPFLWDMYKEIWWYHREQAMQFLEWIEVDEEYRNIFFRLNGVKKWVITLEEMNYYFERYSWKNKWPFKDIREELQNYIDKYHISL